MDDIDCRSKSSKWMTKYLGFFWSVLTVALLIAFLVGMAWLGIEREIRIWTR